MKKKKCREKQLHFANQWKSKPKSQIKSLFIYLFINEWAKIWNTFFFIIKLNYKIKYFKSSVVDTTLTQQNIGDKLLKVGKKRWYISKKKKGKIMMSVMDQNKN